MRSLRVLLFASMLIFSMVAHAEQPDLSISSCLDSCKAELDRCVDTSRSFVVPEQLKKQVDVCEEKGEFCAHDCYESGQKAIRAYRQCLEKLALKDELGKRAECARLPAVQIAVKK